MLKPADSGGPARGLPARVSVDDLDAHLHAALAESSSGEAIVERFHEGLELNGLVVARGGEAIRSRSPTGCARPGIGFGVGWIHVYPATIFGDALDEAERVATRAVHALGLRERDRVPAADRLRRRRGARGRGRGARSRAGRWPTSRGTPSGVDLVEVALRQALGVEVPDELV